MWCRWSGNVLIIFVGCCTYRCCAFSLFVRVFQEPSQLPLWFSLRAGDAEARLPSLEKSNKMTSQKA